MKIPGMPGIFFISARFEIRSRGSMQSTPQPETALPNGPQI
jgi:hypothetical protein